MKAAVVSREFGRQNVEEKIIHTGQHFDHGMSQVFFEEMEIPTPQYNLGVHSMSHGAMTGAMLSGIETILLEEKPDLLLVYGDTNSTLAGALAAKKLHIPVAHVEAGLRSFNMEMPEEINRILTDRISDVLFAPTDSAIENLEKEGFPNEHSQLVRTGDVMQDAALYYAASAEKRSDILNKIGLEKFILCTLHRAENTDDPKRLKEFVNGLNEINKQIPVVLPLHPRTEKLLQQFDLKLELTVIPPASYFDMICLLKNCSMVITDSGGLQKEAYFFSKNCVTMRDQTEWSELVTGGFNTLAKADSAHLFQQAMLMLEKDNNFDPTLYGGGKAAEQIVSFLKQRYSIQ